MDQSTVERARQLKLITDDEVDHFASDAPAVGVGTPIGNPPPVMEPVEVVDDAERLTSVIRSAASGAPAFASVRKVVVDAAGHEVATATSGQVAETSTKGGRAVIVVVGRICDREGMSVSRGPLYGSVLESRSIPSTAYLDQQPSTIAVDVDHDGYRIGSVEYLRRDHDGLWAVAECSDDRIADLPGPCYWSSDVETRSSDPGPVWEASSAVLRSLALTYTPAQINAQPVVMARGRLDDGDACLDPCWDARTRQLVAWAIEYRRSRAGRRSAPHTISEPIDAARVDHLVDAYGRRVATLYDGEPVQSMEQRSHRRFDAPVDRPKNLAADVEHRYFAVNLGAVKVEPRAHLLIATHPVGRHVAEHDHPE